MGIHTHNDSGLAVANALASVKAGATQVQGTLAGFGERCGNANLSTLTANIVLKLGLECLQPDSLPKLSRATRRVAEIANVNFDEGLPYVGLHAFAHKAGMHVDAVTKTPISFEHVPPETVGNARRILASEVGGRSVILERVKRLDPTATKESPLVAQVVKRLKEMERLGYQFEGADAQPRAADAEGRGEVQAVLRARPLPHDRRGADAEGRLSAQAMVKIRVDGEDAISAARGRRTRERPRSCPPQGPGEILSQPSPRCG